jgi:hypothetical protein
MRVPGRLRDAAEKIGEQTIHLSIFHWAPIAIGVRDAQTIGLCHIFEVSVRNRNKRKRTLPQVRMEVTNTCISQYLSKWRHPLSAHNGNVSLACIWRVSWSQSLPVLIMNLKSSRVANRSSRSSLSSFHRPQCAEDGQKKLSARLLSLSANSQKKGDVIVESGATRIPHLNLRKSSNGRLRVNRRRTAVSVNMRCRSSTENPVREKPVDNLAVVKEESDLTLTRLTKTNGEILKGARTCIQKTLWILPGEPVKLN